MKVQDRTPERLGPYRLLRRLGEGGMGVVYLAADAAGQLVAVKALHPAMAAEENARRRLAREVETMRRVRSPYVAEVVDADVDGDPPYIVTRYVPGLTLDAIVSQSGPLMGTALARLACGLAEALAAVHAAGVVHRDLKPGNVMIADGEPVVIDFGIAQLPETSRLTMTGMFMGTPGYLAPEVIEGKESGCAADVHSLGATLAFAAIGRPPFGTGTFETIFYRIVHGQPDLDTLPVPLRPLVLRSLSRDPAARPSAAELSQWAASLDPAALVPGPAMLVAGDTVTGGPAAAGAAAGGAVAGGAVAGRPAAMLGGPSDTMVDQPGGLARPNSTRPLPAARPGDVRDLLPPVHYGPVGGVPDAPGLPADRRTGAPGAGSWAGGPPWPGGAGLAGGPGFAGGAGLAGGPGFAGGAGLAGGAGSAGAGPGWAELPGRVGTGGPAGAAPLAAGAKAGRGQGTAGPVSAWSPLVIATIAVLAAASVLAPIIGTGIALVLLVALRAASITSRQLAKRRSADGRRAGDRVVAIAFYPLAVLRSLVSLLLLAPITLLGFCVAAAITIIAVPVHPLPLAVAFGAGTLVAMVGLGPGSGSSRRTLASLFGSVARTPSRLAVAYVGVLALAAWAGTTAVAQPAAYWPVGTLHAELAQLSTVHSMLSDIRLSLLRLARQFGL